MRYLNAQKPKPLDQMTALASLIATTVPKIFDTIMVNDPNQSIRDQNHEMLGNLGMAMNIPFDWSKIEKKRKPCTTETN